jgi:aspartate/methionine/tyrosine aminotransferase
MRSSQRGKVDPFIVMDIMEQARKADVSGKDIIHMEVGQPGTAAPKAAIDFLKKSIGKETLGYTVALGLPELRKKIARLYGDWYNIDLDWNRVIVTPGSSGAFLLSFISLFDKGDIVGLGNPGYPSYRQIIKALDLVPKLFKTDQESNFQPKLKDIKAFGVQGLLLASPANPTGTMIEKEKFREFAQLCEERDISLISDEIYHGIEYEKKAVTALEFTDSCYVVNSFSKYFCMTGWRIGWMIVPNSHIRIIEKLAQNMFICAPHVSQIAAIGAFEGKLELNQNIKTYKRNRELLKEGLYTAGFKNIASPDGAFYIYADISAFSKDSLFFAKKLLDEAGIAATPGIDFDPILGKTKLRFSYARSTKEIIEGIERLIKFMKK